MSNCLHPQSQVKNKLNLLNHSCISQQHHLEKQTILNMAFSFFNQAIFSYVLAVITTDYFS